MKFKVDVLINSPKDSVWKTITDIEKSVDIISGIINIKILHKPADDIVGLKWQETRRMFGKDAEETMWITEAKENEFYTVRAESHGAVYLSVLSLDPTDEGVKLSMDFSAEPQSFPVKIISAFVGIFVKKSMIKMMQQDLNDIKNHLEKFESN